MSHIIIFIESPNELQTMKVIRDGTFGRVGAPLQFSNRSKAVEWAENNLNKKPYQVIRTEDFSSNKLMSSMEA